MSWVCDHGNGVFDHDWKWIHDYEGDPSVINGTCSFSYRECKACGVQDHEIPYVYEPLEDDVL